MSAMAQTSLYDVPDWSLRLAQAGMAEEHAEEVGSWMDGVLGTEFTRPPE